jgi:hypothetical protein
MMELAQNEQACRILRMSVPGLGCVKTPKLNLRTEISSRPSINLKNKSADDGCRDIEKTILRAFRARTFSRSLGDLMAEGDATHTSGLFGLNSETLRMNEAHRSRVD